MLEGGCGGHGGNVVVVVGGVEVVGNRWLSSWELVDGSSRW